MSMSTDGFAKNKHDARLEGVLQGQPGRYQITLGSGREAELKPSPKRDHESSVGLGRLQSENPEGRLKPTPTPRRAGATRSNLVYVLGQIRCDLGAEDADGVALPRDANVLLQQLDADPGRAADLTWTLEQGGRPVYVLRPGGALVEQAYERLRTILRAQAAGRLVRASVPGVDTGRIVLAGGRPLPVLEPEPFGLYAWLTPPNSTSAPREVRGASAAGRPLCREESGPDAAECSEQGCDDLRNPGVSSRERAINYAATDAFHTGTVYAAALHQGMRLASVDACADSACRPGADCWNVTLTFVRPAPGRARMVYRFVVDVGDAVPVTVGKVRSFDLC
jgi:hypothetical protein